MAWESRNGHGSYYTRSIRVGGQVVREYVGCGLAALLIAELDAHDRQQREAEAEAWREERARLDALDAQVAQLDALADLLARAMLIAKGYHQHKRGEWRKRRDKE